MTEKLRRFLMLGTFVVALGVLVAGTVVPDEYDWDSVPSAAVADNPATTANSLGRIELLAEYDWD